MLAPARLITAVTISITDFLLTCMLYGMKIPLFLQMIGETGKKNSRLVMRRLSE